ncbi:MAG: alpha-ketoglutarate-dependent dioxygenase AlkB [Acidimicrobiaceae bacterium]|nr:alpha-ketoglutarate-dependent dioxygenase AlkB [Acidimicrobiaceae bacterium]
MSVQLSLLPEESTATEPDVDPPLGLEYHPQLLTAHGEAELLEWIDAHEWLTDLSRRVQHFGYKYDYSNRRLDDSAHIGPLPEWLTQLAHKVRATASEDVKCLLDSQRPFEQAIVNEYLPGQGIAPHVDRDCFGPVVATVSLGSAVSMDFCRKSGGVEFVQRLEPRSLLLIYGDARARWRHGIAKRRSDAWNGQKIERRRRVSITFRTVPDSRELLHS